METNPSTIYHSDAVKAINADGYSKIAAGEPQIELSEEVLLAAARKETGLERFGDESFLTPLRILLKALNTEAQLNPWGRMHAFGHLLGCLKNILWVNACFEAHPEILERKLPCPIIIMGPHRSGTTRMQRMMSSDPQLQFLSLWEGINPGPRPGPDMGKAQRRQEVKGAFEAFMPMYPEAFDGHSMDADFAEEEFALLNLSFSSFFYMCNYTVPSYYEWFKTADLTFAYRQMANLMKLISWQRGDPEDKRWILKDPEHMMNMDVLMKVFPDARPVFTHRDPLKTVASTLSLMWLFARQHTDRPIRADMRDVWLDFCEVAARRCIESRKKIPAPQQLDVLYEDINKDWKSVMRRVYEFGGIPFNEQAERALGDWLERSEREGNHTAHRYALEDFGVTGAEVEARMKFVRDLYNIPVEKKRDRPA